MLYQYIRWIAVGLGILFVIGAGVFSMVVN